VWVIADNARQGYLGYNEFVKARARARRGAALRARGVAAQPCRTRALTRRALPQAMRAIARAQGEQELTLDSVNYPGASLPRAQRAAAQRSAAPR
jgi:hypothetical protein